MEKSLNKLLSGYQEFKKKYASGDNSTMQLLASDGQKPEALVVACCDSRVDPAVILQCDPGELFVVRNVANIIPPYEQDDAHHGTSAALEFGICYLKVKHLIILGHSQCGGIDALLNSEELHQNDFIGNWVELIEGAAPHSCSVDDYAKEALKCSHQNCLTFPWIKERLEQGTLKIHLWFFDIKEGQIFAYSAEEKKYFPLKQN